MTELKWIPVETKPTTNREVLIWIDRQGAKMSHWNEAKQEWDGYLNGNEQARVTHWADVPEPQ